MNRFHFICFAFIYLAVSSCKSPGKNSSKLIDSKNLKKTSTITDTINPVKIDESDLKALVDTLNDYLTSYDLLLSGDRYNKSDLQKLKLTKNEIDTLIQNDPEPNGVLGSDISSTYQVTIDDLLNKVLNHPKIVKYDLGRILQNIGVTKSDDGKLYDLILRENTGGSHLSNISYLQYRSKNGKVYNFSRDSEIFNSDGFDKIYLTSTKHGSKYVLYGAVRSCSTCISEYIQLVHFDSEGKPFIDFSFSTGEHGYYDSDAGGASQEITYDDQKKYS